MTNTDYTLYSPNRLSKPISLDRDIRNRFTEVGEIFCCHSPLLVLRCSSIRGGADVSASMVTLSSPSPSLSCVENVTCKSSHVSRVLISGTDNINHGESSEAKILRDVHIVRTLRFFFESQFSVIWYVQLRISNLS